MRTATSCPHRRNVSATFVDRHGREFDVRGVVLFRDGDPVDAVEMRASTSVLSQPVALSQWAFLAHEREWIRQRLLSAALERA